MLHTGALVHHVENASPSSRPFSQNVPFTQAGYTSVGAQTQHTGCVAPAASHAMLASQGNSGQSTLLKKSHQAPQLLKEHTTHIQAAHTAD